MNRFESFEQNHNTETSTQELPKTENQENRVVLIGVGNYDAEGNQTAEESSHRASWPYLGPLVVGTEIETCGFDVSVYDENVEGPIQLEEIITQGAVLGLSAVVTSIERSLSLAHKAKELGARYVFMGNDQAAARAKHILTEHSEVDAVFLHDALAPVRAVFHELKKMNHMPQDEVPGVAIRNGKTITNPPLPYAHALDLPVPNFHLYPPSYWERVGGNHRNLNGFEYDAAELQTIKNASIVLASGCPHGKDACAYCSIREIANLKWGDQKYYERLMEAYDSFGINSFFNVTDDFSGFMNVVKILHEIGVKFPHLTTYARAFTGSHTPKNIERIRDLVDPSGHLKLNVGLDSGDGALLKNSLNKGHGIKENEDMVKLMKTLGIWGHFSFIFGAPGETEETCKKTLDFIAWCADTMGRLLANLESDIFWLTAGAPCDKIFHDYPFAREYAAYAGKELPQGTWEKEFHAHARAISIPWSVQEAWYFYFTNISLNFAQECNEKVRAIAQHAHANFGRAYGTISPPQEIKKEMATIP